MASKAAPTDIPLTLEDADSVPVTVDNEVPQSAENGYKRNDSVSPVMTKTESTKSQSLEIVNGSTVMKTQTSTPENTGTVRAPLYGESTSSLFRKTRQKKVRVANPGSSVLVAGMVDMLDVEAGQSPGEYVLFLLLLLCVELLSLQIM